MVKPIWIISAVALVAFFLAGGNQFVKPAFEEAKNIFTKSKETLKTTVTDIKEKSKGDQVG